MWGFKGAVECFLPKPVQGHTKKQLSQMMLHEGCCNDSLAKSGEP